MSDVLTISSAALKVQFALNGARMRGVFLNGGENLILDADPEEHPEWVGSYGGTIVGPLANRVRDGRVVIGDTAHQMPQNEGSTCLHSGPDGVHVRPWTVVAHAPSSLTLACDLPDGACGLPGERHLETHCEISGSSLVLTLTGTTSRPTAMALAHHPYWRLGTQHRLRVAASRYLPKDELNLPTGDIKDVTGTPYDFRTSRAIPRDIDHCLCLNQSSMGKLSSVATLDGSGGTSLDIATTEPGLQVYGGAFLPTIAGTPIAPGAGIALEPQGWPDAINNSGFPSVLITPDAPYRQITRYTLR